MAQNLFSNINNNSCIFHDNDYLLSPQSNQLINEIDYQIIHQSINTFITLDILKITINSGNASGLYTCYSNNLTTINTDQIDSMSFQVIATSSREYADYKFKRPSITGFIVGMIPSIMLFFYIIMSLGYRSRYAMDQEEEEEGFGI
ncbi:uncharacterized protein LOC128392476 [Panonychus citri]|uniref:uncharacterized protein LOC128392476 n=1 Tax=Panonychus citri TaxID=50023 RepID=UPI002307FEDF|nr:uncharacterized protein LOC128392476 [Panonychus citri]